MANKFNNIALKALLQNRSHTDSPPGETIPLEENAEAPKEEEGTKPNGLKSASVLNQNMADVAWKVHSAQKAAGVFKEKMNLRRRIQERLKLKERMRQLVEERLTIIQIFKRYVESSTLHGFRYTCTKTYLIRRVIWTILMVAGALYFILKLHDGLVTYFNYPFSTKATLEFVDSLIFPAISFCPINQFRYSKVRNSSLEQLFRSYDSRYYRNISGINFNIPGDVLVSEIKDKSFSIEDIYKACDYIRRDTDHPQIPPRLCGIENFTSYFSDTGKYCFTLNSGQVGHQLLEVDQKGLSHGFELTFDLHNNDVLHQHGISGLQVIVHDQNEPPTRATGFIIPTGFKSFVQMERTETQNLPPPYATECGEKKLKYYSKYNQKGCVLELLTDYIGEKCGCREPFMPDNSLPYCSLKQVTSCLNQVKDTFNEYEMRALCPIDCQQTSYETRRSDARFLHDPPKGIERIMIESSLYSKGLNRSHILDLTEKYNNTALDKYIEDNIIVVIFYYGEMSKVINIQIASFNFYNFLGDIGGAFGLMLGASLLTFFEFVDLFVLLLYHQMLRLHKKQKWEKEDRKSMNVEEKQQLINLKLSTSEK